MKAHRTLMFCLLLAGYAVADPVVNTYKDPAFTSTVSNILVVGAHEDRNVRGQFENSVVRALRAAGANGESSLARMGSNQALTTEALLAAAQRAGADAVLVTRVLDVQSRDKVEQGVTDVNDTAFVDFFSHKYAAYQDPLTSTTTSTIIVGSDLYTVADQAKVWSTESTAFDKENLFAVIDTITTAITAQLGSDRLIK